MKLKLVETNCSHMRIEDDKGNPLSSLTIDELFSGLNKNDDINIIKMKVICKSIFNDKSSFNINNINLAINGKEI